MRRRKLAESEEKAGANGWPEKFRLEAVHVMPGQRPNPPFFTIQAMVRLEYGIRHREFMTVVSND